MAKEIITYSDFTGYFDISQNNNIQAKLTYFISRFQPAYLKDLLGITLYNLFYADLDGSTPSIPQNTPYTTIFNEFSSETDGCIHVSEGMKEMMKGFIFFEFVRSLKIKTTESGQIINQLENSQIAAAISYNDIAEKYNKAIETYNEIQWYINENSSDFPDFNGRSKERIGWC